MTTDHTQKLLDGLIEIRATVQRDIEDRDWPPPSEAMLSVLRIATDAVRAASSGVPGTTTELLEGRNSQHVLKAEGESPDATDRENCAKASPDGGPMGAGQAAAAAPIGAVLAPDDIDLASLRGSVAYLRSVATTEGQRSALDNIERHAQAVFHGVIASRGGLDK